MYSRYLNYEVELQDGNRFVFNKKLLLNIFRKKYCLGDSFKKIVGSYDEGIRNRLRVITERDDQSDDKMRMAVRELPHDVLLLMFRFSKENHSYCDIVIFSKKNDVPDSKKINVTVIGGVDRISHSSEDESSSSFEERQTAKEVEAAWLKELEPLTSPEIGCVIEHLEYKENLEEDMIDDLPNLDGYLVLSNAARWVFSYFRSLPCRLQPIDMTDLVELGLRHGMPKKLRAANGFKQISRYILNVDELVQASKLYPELKFDEFDACINTLERKKSSTVYYDPAFNLLPKGIGLIKELMKGKVIDHDKFSIPTDKSSLEVIKKLKAKIIKIFELWNYNFKHWEKLIKPDFLETDVPLPSNNQALVNQDSLFYLMMNHGTSGVNSTLHTIDQPTQSMRRWLEVFDLHRCADEARHHVYKCSFAYYKCGKMFQKEYGDITIDGFNLNHLIVIAQGYRLQMQDIKDQDCNDGESLDKSSEENYKRYQEKVLAIISENPNQDWVDMLGYREFQKQSKFSMSFFDNALPSEASIREGLVFRIMNRDVDQKTLNPPNRPTKAMKDLLGILKKQKLTKEKNRAMQPH